MTPTYNLGEAGTGPGGDVARLTRDRGTLATRGERDRGVTDPAPWANARRRRALLARDGGGAGLQERIEAPGWVASTVEDTVADVGARVCESLPGLVSWAVLSAPIWLTLINPQAGELFVFLATTIFGLKAGIYALRALRNRRRVLEGLQIDWLARLQAECQASKIDLARYRVTLLIRAYREANVAILRETLESICQSAWPRHGERLAQVEVLFATEADDPITPPIVRRLADEFEPRLRVRQIVHPFEPGTLPGPSTAMHYVGRRLYREASLAGLSPRRWLIADFDCDTLFHPQYIACLMYHFLRDPERDHHAYQPVVLFTTQYWRAPLHSRLAALATSVLTLSWLRRPEIAFTGAAASLELLHSVDYWPTNSHSQDSGIETRWRMRYGRRFTVVGLPITLSVYPVMVVGATETLRSRMLAYWNSFRALFRQSARWREGPLDEFVEALRQWHLPVTFQKLWNGLERDTLTLMPIVGYALARATNQLVNSGGIVSSGAVCIVPLPFLSALPLIGGLPELASPFIAGVLSLVSVLGLVVFSALLDGDDFIKGAVSPARRVVELLLFWLVFSIYMPILTALAGLKTSTAYLLGRRPRGHFNPTPK